MSVNLNSDYDLKRLQEQQSQGSQKSGSSNGTTGTDKSLFDQDAEQAKLDARYKDSDNMSAKDAFKKLKNAGIIDGSHYDRMVCAASKLVNNEKWQISMADENGNISNMALADAVAASFDSELDLYIQDIVGEVMAKYGSCSKKYLSDEARAELAAKGIRVDSVGAEDGSNTNRVYSFSLVELPANASEMTKEELMEAVYSDDAKIVEDKAGNKASFLFADCLIPDGYAQNAEVNLSSILDTMGYDCISKADFIDSDLSYDQVMQEVQAYLNSDEVVASGTIHDIYGNVKDIAQSITNLWGGSGSAPGQNGISGDQEALEAAEEEAYEENYEKILDKKKAEYKDEHGEEATGKDLLKLETEAQNEAKIAAKNTL